MEGFMGWTNEYPEIMTILWADNEERKPVKERERGTEERREGAKTPPKMWWSDLQMSHFLQLSIGAALTISWFIEQVCWQLRAWDQLVKSQLGERSSWQEICTKDTLIVNMKQRCRPDASVFIWKAMVCFLSFQLKEKNQVSEGS